ncbi:hypothetical protein J4205_03660 [Candidatus Pacearchaeota archaeon]|nr:hypothetical protein [Candidatus Pacearchaeota archaeon]
MKQKNKINAMIAVILLVSGIYYTVSSSSFNIEFFRTTFESILGIF